MANPNNEPEERNLYAEAFLNQYNILLLIGAFIASLILASAFPAIVAAGVELIYMIFVPDSALFKRYVEAKYAEEDAEKLLRLPAEILSNTPVAPSPPAGLQQALQAQQCPQHQHVGKGEWPPQQGRPGATGRHGAPDAHSQHGQQVVQATQGVQQAGHEAAVIVQFSANMGASAGR